MALFTVRNLTESRVRLPSPLQGEVPPQESITIDIPASYMDVPQIAEYIHRGVLSITVRQSPNDPDEIELVPRKIIPAAALPGVETATAGFVLKADGMGSVFFAPNVQFIPQIKTVGRSGDVDFTSITSAVNSITDASGTNRYIVYVYPGNYIEDTIVMKPFVSVAGIDPVSTFITVNATNKDVVHGADFSELAHVTLHGATAPGFAAVRHNSPTGSSVTSFFLNEVRFGNNDTLVIAEGAAPGTTSTVNSSDLRYGSSFQFNRGFYATSVGGGNGRIIIRASTSTGMTAPDPVDFAMVDAPGCEIVLNGVQVRTGSSSPTGTCLHASNGGRIRAVGVNIRGWLRGIWADAAGPAPIINATAILNEDNTHDIVIDHPGTTGSFTGVAEITKIAINSASTFPISANDPVGKGSITVGQEFLLGAAAAQAVDVLPLIEQTPTMGLITGGMVTDGGGLLANVSAGFGYLVVPSTTLIKKVAWGMTSLALMAGTEQYIIINSTGVLTTSAFLPDTTQNLILARAVTGASSIDFIDLSPLNAFHSVNYLERFNREALGAVFATGSIVGANPDRSLGVSSGIYFFSQNEFDPSGGNPVTFTQYYRNGSGSHVKTSGLTIVENTSYDDGSGTLAAIPAGQYTKHTLYLVGQGTTEKYFLVLGQDIHTSQLDAEKAPNPLPPNYFRDGVVILAAIIVQQGTSTIVEVIDERPRIGFAPSATSSTNVHGNLLGLLADDHPQYLRTDGTRTLAGNLNLGGFAISNVSTVDGINVLLHGSRHAPDNADPIPVGTPVTIGTANSPGIANSLARSDHVHGHGLQTSPNQHAVATETAAGFLSAADKVILDNLALGNVSYTVRNETGSTIPAGVLLAPTGYNTGLGVVLVAPADKDTPALSPAIAIASTAIPTGTTTTALQAGTISGLNTSAFSLTDQLILGNSGTYILSPSGNTGVTGQIQLVGSVIRVDATNGIIAFNLTTGVLPITSDQVYALQGTSGSPTTTNRFVTDSDSRLASPAAPANVNKGAASPGVATARARADHKHDVDTAAPGTINIGDSATEGTATTLTRSDHTHALPAPAAPGTITVGATPTAGSATSPARADHTHGLTAPPAPVIVDKSTALAGTATTVARSDHKHDVSTAAPAGTGVQIGNVASEGTATTLARSDHSHTVTSAAPTTGAVAIGNAAADGTAITFSRSDHQHAVASGNAVDVGTANAAGASATFSRSDHVHNTPFSAVQTALAAATGSVSLNNQRITTVGDPTGAQDVATKNYVDTGITSGDWKSSTRMATTANITLSGVQTIDGVVGVAGDRVLVKNQTAGPQNGLYVQSSGTWSRSTDATSNTQFTAGLTTLVTEGTVNAGTQWFVSTVDPINVGTSTITFAPSQLTNTAPVAVDKSTALVGTGILAARSDHKHDVSTAATTGNVTIGATATEGTATTLARSDHVHPLTAPPAPGSINVGDVASTGASVLPSRADHTHGLPAPAPPVAVDKSTALAGSSTNVARQDHKHDVSTGTPVSTAVQIGNTATEGTATTLARSDHSHTVVSAAPVVGAVVIGNTATDGVASTFSRSDHLHAIASGTPVDIGTANAPGTASTFTRSDHVHNLPFSATQTALAAATGAVSFNGQQITNVADPTTAQGVATKAYVDAGVTTNDWKNSTRVGTTANIALTGLQTIDGVVGIAGDRVLVKNQTTASQNGIYVQATGAWTRAIDSDTNPEFTSGLALIVTEGTINAGTQWYVSTPDPINLGTTSIAFAPSQLTTVAPLNVDKSTTQVGIAILASRADHKHDISTATPGPVTIGASAAEGVATTIARSDHAHSLPAPSAATTINVGDTASAGVSTAPARGDHTHALPAPAAPANVNKGTASAGASSNVARQDHKHDVDTAAPGTINVGDTATEGVASTLTRSDHTHALPAPTAPVAVDKSTALAGTATTVARSDHKHDVSTTTPVTATGTTNTEGTASTIARSDHVHRTTLQALSTGTVVASRPAFNFSGTTVTVVDNTGSDRVDISINAPAISNTAPANVNKSAAAVGVLATAARSDHKHDVDTAVVGTINLGDVASEGTAATLTRSDHVHAFPSPAAPVNVTKAAASAGVATTVARSDHKHDISTATPGSLNIGDTATEGTATTLTRSDHTHGFTAPGAPVAVDKSTASAGVSTSPARADHKHDVTTAAPVTATGTANSEGTANTISRSDHLHRTTIGVQDEGITLTSRPIFNFVGTAITATDDSVNDRTVITVAAAALTTVAPVNVDKSTAAVGVATDAARQDHKHDITTASAIALTVGGASAEGTATTIARSDHTHALPAPAAPANVNKSAAATGSSTNVARQDHKHDVDTAAPGAITVGAAATEGTATTLTRSDHIHSLAAPAAPVAVDKSVASAGASVNVARQDHKHDITTAAPGTINVGDTSTEGTSTAVARSDHTHTLTAPTAPVNVNKGTASAGTATTVARSDHKHDIDTLTAVALTVGITSAEGVASTIARSDHTHAITAATPVDIGTANAPGSATTFVRSDHVHNLPFSAVQTALGAASSAVSFNNQRLTNVTDPSSAQDAATKNYVDSQLTGPTDYKASVRAGSSGATLTLSGTQTVDGVALIAGDRILVKDQTTGANNGIYTVSSGAWVRGTDADTSAKVTSQLQVSVEEGTINSRSTWKLDTINPITLGTTALVFNPIVVTTITAPTLLTKAAAVIGTSLFAARADHKHDVSTAAGITGIGGGNLEGTATTLARSDHNHAIHESGGTDLTLGAIADGEILHRSGTTIAGGVGKRYANGTVNPTSPVPAAGDQYYNTTLEMMLTYDGTRSKWLSNESYEFQVGRLGNTAPSSYYRGIDSLVLSATQGFPAHFNGTLISLSYTRADVDSATFEVTANGTTQASLVSTATSGRSTTVNADVNAGDILAVRNATGSNITTDVSVWVRLKWRV